MAKQATAAKSSPNFGSILDKPAGTAERPVPVPAGTYVGVIQGLPIKDKSSKKQTDYIEYNIKLLKPYENEDGETDVDADELKEMGGIAGKEMKLTFYFTEKSMFMHDDFLKEVMGIEPDGEQNSWDYAQTLNGQQLLVFVKQEPRQDGKGMRSVIAKTMMLPSE